MALQYKTREATHKAATLMVLANNLAPGHEKTDQERQWLMDEVAKIIGGERGVNALKIGASFMRRTVTAPFN